MWTRVCVDQDQAGRSIGCSVEVHTEDGPATIWTSSCAQSPDPYDAMETALTWRAKWLGEQLALF